jgi:uncharacterized damage-inducible protein DinB
LTPNLAAKLRILDELLGRSGTRVGISVFEISELYEYSSRVRRSFAEKLAQLPPETVSKNREASFYSMKNILLHIIDNEDWIVNWVIPGRSQAYVRKKWEDYRDMVAVLTHLDEVEKGTRTYLQGLTQEDFGRRVDFVLSSGRTFNLSLEECLFQSFTEQLYHMGELIALLWQENVEPPKMQWFWNNPREANLDKSRAL